MSKIVVVWYVLTSTVFKHVVDASGVDFLRPAPSAAGSYVPQTTLNPATK